MPNIKKSIKLIVKKFFYSLNLVVILDRFVYWSTYIKNKSKNNRFRKANPELKLPPDYYLYETYKLDYEGYINDGVEFSKEILDWTRPYLPEEKIKILDWGCGVSRSCRHLKTHTGGRAEIHGCDINPAMIEWNKKNLPDIKFELIGYNPPTQYPDDLFDFAYGISIFTHIESDRQEGWFREIHRILKPGGIFLFTTHGTNCFDNLLTDERKILLSEGAFTKYYSQKGHRMMTSYNTKSDILDKINDRFEVLEFYEKEETINRTGLQDLWIVKKK